MSRFSSLIKIYFITLCTIIPTASSLDPETVHWLSTDPKCHEDNPIWKELRHVITLPDEFFNQEAHYSNMGDRALNHELGDYKRMFAAAQFEAGRGFLELILSDPYYSKRCFLGTVTFLYYLFRYRLYSDGDIESCMQIIRILDGYLSAIHPEQIDYFNALAGDLVDLEHTNGFKGYALGVKNNTLETADIDPWNGISSNGHMKKIFEGRITGKKNVPEVLKIRVTGSESSSSDSESSDEFYDPVIPPSAPRPTESWHWPIFSGHLALNERQFLSNLANGDPFFNKLKIPKSDSDTDSEDSSDDINNDSGIWMGNAFSMWPTDELVSDTVVPVDQSLAYFNKTRDNIESGSTKTQGVNSDLLFRSTPDYEKQFNRWDVSDSDVGGEGGISSFTGLPLLGSAFKVYVYEPEEIPALKRLTLGPHFCRKRYPERVSAEVTIHNWFLSCPNCVTRDPNEADFFFVPAYASCHYHAQTFGDSDSESTAYLNRLFTNLVHGNNFTEGAVSNPQLPYFSRSNGRDHIFVWTESIEKVFPDWRKYISESIFLSQQDSSNYGSTSSSDSSNLIPEFSPFKDIAIPSLTLLDTLFEQSALSSADVQTSESDAVQNADENIPSDQILPPPKDWESRRFTGYTSPAPSYNNRHGNTEIIGYKNLHHWMDVYRSEGYAQSGKTYFGDFHIKSSDNERIWGAANSKFCLVPHLEEFPRLLFSGCVLVLIDDKYEIPFQQLLGSQDMAMKFFYRAGENVKYNLDIHRFPSSSIYGKPELVQPSHIKGDTAKVSYAFNWLITWPQDRVDRDLAVYLRQFTNQVGRNLASNSRKIKCWFVYPPSLVSSDFNPVRIKKICPGWKRQNALIAIHSLLAKKKLSVNKASDKVFYLPNPKTGTFNLVNKDFNLMQRVKPVKGS